MRQPPPVSLRFVIVAVLLSAGCGVTAPGDAASAPESPAPAVSEPPTAPTPSPSSLAWEECGAPFECATLTVPVDHADPDGPTVPLALIRLPAPPQAERLGSIVVNPGGPGASGVDFVRDAAVATIPAEVRARFDIVGFDPRGVGGSAPLACGLPPSALLDVDLAPDDDGETDALLAAASTFAASCAAHAGDLLGRVATDAVVDDLDLLRDALGDERLTYIGYSYGTLIGGRYAERYGERVRALVLDGAVDPSLDVVGRAREKAQRLEEALAAFAQACDADVSCADPGGLPTAQLVDGVLQAVETSPLAAPQLGGDRTLGPGQALTAIATLVAERGPRWELLGMALHDAAAGDGSLLLAVAEGTVEQEDDGQSWLDPLLAVNCLDLPAPAPPDLVEAAEQLETIAPHFGALSLYLSAACSYWPVASTAVPAPFAADTAHPVVVIGTTGDGVTPYQWSQRVAEQLPDAVLLTRDGETHTAFGDGNVCTSRAVTSYLVDLIRPREETICG